MTEYWVERSYSYSQQVRGQMASDRRDIWEGILLDNAPKQDRPLRVLDVGTGPGFFSLLLAQKGHRVTGVDLSGDMLDRARENAQYYGVEAEFLHLDGGDLPFADESFDLVISRDVTWTLPEPAQVFQEWSRVTRPGGRVLYFDANWYHYLYNPDFRRTHEENQRICREKGGFQYDKADVMEEIARDLPMSKWLRPHWDIRHVPAFGFSQVTAIENLNPIIYTEMERMQYQSKQEFLVIAEK